MRKLLKSLGYGRVYELRQVQTSRTVSHPTEFGHIACLSIRSFMWNNFGLSFRSRISIRFWENCWNILKHYCKRILSVLNTFCELTIQWNMVILYVFRFKILCRTILRWTFAVEPPFWFWENCRFIGPSSCSGINSHLWKRPMRVCCRTKWDHIAYPWFLNFVENKFWSRFRIRNFPSLRENFQNFRKIY